MRKADYLTMADIFKRQRAAAYMGAADARAANDAERAAFNEGKAAAVEMAADCFARESTISRAAFLTLCGLTDKPPG